MFMQTEEVDMMEGDNGPNHVDQNDGMKPQKVEGLGISACWRLFKRGVRGVLSSPVLPLPAPPHCLLCHPTPSSDGDGQGTALLPS